MKQSLLIAALLALAVTGCAKKEEAPAPEAAPAPAAAPAPEAAPALLLLRQKLLRLLLLKRLLPLRRQKLLRHQPSNKAHPKKIAGPRVGYFFGRLFFCPGKRHGLRNTVCLQWALLQLLIQQADNPFRRRRVIHAPLTAKYLHKAGIAILFDLDPVLRCLHRFSCIAALPEHQLG